MFAVRFIRVDRQPDEEYLYSRQSDAEQHFELFREDTSGLYQRIELLDVSGQDRLLDEIVFQDTLS